MENIGKYHSLEVTPQMLDSQTLNTSLLQ